MTLTKTEIELIRNALYAHRQFVRSQESLAMQEHSFEAKRDAERFGKIITACLRLDEKLSDMMNENATK